MADKKKLTIKYFPASELTTFPGNPRKVKDPDAVKKLTKLIELHGFQNPLNVWQHEGVNYILCGNHRFKAACDLGHTEFPCIVYSGTKEEALARCIADNKSSDWTEFDYPLLKDMITEIDLGHLDIEITGFGEEELEALFGYEGLTEEEQAEKDAMEDEVPDVPAEPITKPGDLYLLGRHRLLCGDSTNITDVERLMDGKKADMVFTDPPYGVSYSDKNIFLNVMDKGNHIQKDIENDAKTPAEMKDFWVAAFSNLHLSTTDKASYYVTGPQSGELMMMMMMSLDLSGWQLKHMLIWAKNNHVLGRCDYHYKHEPILYGWKQKGTHEFFGNASNVSVWNIDKPLKSDLHPTMKPIEVMEKAINNSTKSGQRVLDLFLGSGSTLIACEKTGRTCYGMELDAHYCDVIVARWEKFTGKKAKLCQPS